MNIARKTLAVCSGLALVMVLVSVPVAAQTTKTWVGDTEEWNDALHWLQIGVPGPNDDVLHTWTQGVHGILMDVPVTFPDRYEVQEFRLDPDWVNATEQGSLKLRGYECFEEFPPPCSDSSRLQFVGGMDASGTAQNPLDPNLYKIQLGPTDIVMVGEATLDRQPGGVIEKTTHFEWELGGEDAGNPPTAWISGEIGPGKWTVDQGVVHVGFATNFDNIIDIIEASPGKVDSQVTAPILNYLDPTYDGASMWRIDGGRVACERGQV